MSIVELWRRIGTLVRRDRMSAEVEEEIRLHVSLRAEQLRDGGAVAADARAEARRRFGNPARTGERARDEWGLQTIEIVAQDVRYAVRGLSRSPAVTVVIIVTLALGLGVNAAIFSVLDRLFLRAPTGVSAPSSVRRLYLTHPWGPTNQTTDRFNYPQWQDLAGAAGASTQMSVYALDSVRIGTDPGAPRVAAAFVDAAYWQLLGVHPRVGRAFAADEAHINAATNLAIVSDAFWRRESGAGNDIIGQTMLIGTIRYTVVGVAPRGFTGIDLDDVQLWLPLGAMPMPSYAVHPWYDIRGVPMLYGIARLPDAARPEPFEARLTSAFRTGSVPLYKRDTAAVISTGPIVAALGPLKQNQEVVLSTRLAWVSILVLLIACANVANLLLARTVQRRREIAVRLALGISRRRLAAQSMLESAILAACAAVAAAIAGGWTGAALRRTLLPQIHWSDAFVDWRSIALTAGVALVAAVMTGLAPLAQTRHLDVTDALKSGGRDGAVAGRRLRTTLVIVQTALAVVLLAGAGLFVQSLRHVLGVDVGYDVDRIVLAEPQFVSDRGGYENGHDAQRDAGLIEAARRLALNGDVEAVALASSGPMSGYMATDVRIPGRDSTPELNGNEPTMNRVSPEYASVVGMRAVRGRLLSRDDVAGATPAMVINETMARVVWPGLDPIGRCIEPYNDKGQCYTVVGVVRDAHRLSIIESPIMQFFLPLAQGSPAGGAARATTIVVRASPNRVANAINATRLALREVMPTAEPNVIPMEGRLETQLRPWRLGAMLFSVLGGLAFVVAALGVYGVISYSVGVRTHEMGVRLALGAQRERVVRLVVEEGLRTVAIGLVIGVGVALASGRVISSLLYETSSHDPVVFLGVSVAMLTISVIASSVPGWRAARVDPVTALRSD